MKINSKSSGFTLIELLIVVAIIAILAAIAVPNFLEAQTRSKVTRVKADMRSLATALESYYVDANHYVPTTFNFWPRLSPEVWYSDSGHTLWHLTTPVAYITSVLSSPFTTQVSSSTADFWYQYVQYPVVYENQWDNLPWSIEYREANTGEDGEAIFRQSGYSKAMKWMLEDAGPDRKRNDAGVSGLEPYYQMPYDPTNGTVSAGDIYRFGP